MALRCVRLTLAALLGIAVLLGQDFRATVTGQITDPSGGGVSNAKVTVQNLQTNESVTQTTIKAITQFRIYTGKLQGDH